MSEDVTYQHDDGRKCHRTRGWKADSSLPEWWWLLISSGTVEARGCGRKHDAVEREKVAG